MPKAVGLDYLSQKVQGFQQIQSIIIVSKLRAILRMMNLILLVVIVTLIAPLGKALSLPKSEMLALQDLYTATGGESWTWLKPSAVFGYPWDFSSNQNPCSATIPWQGIQCSSTCVLSSCHVISISLSSRHLIGMYTLVLLLFVSPLIFLSSISLHDN
jgi:hypothetical protein